MRRLLALCLLCLLALAGCGTTDEVRDDVERARDRVEREVDRRFADARREFEEARERYGRRLDEILAGLEQVFPEAQETSPTVRSQGRNEPETIDAFMLRVLRDIDQYWERTFSAADLPVPRVGFEAVPPGGVRPTACGQPAGDDAAFYCPADDTIYVAQRFAAELYQGVARGLPGEQAGYGRAAGDFAVAYVLAHEYAHNLQQELGIFSNAVGESARPFELQADCLSGTWANSAYAQGELQPGDLDEITNAALAVGDFDVGNAQHHGTPPERREAVLTGFRSGAPAACNRFVPGL